MECPDCKDSVCFECGSCGCERKEYVTLLIKIKRLYEGRCYDDGDTMVDDAVVLIKEFMEK